MRFDNPETPVTSEELTKIESNLALSIHQDLKSLYLRSNGGSPEPYVYEDDSVDTVVASFLPISSSSGKRTAADTYMHLVRAKKIVPQHYFPFAVDGGGDYFFVDCSSANGMVHFYRSDSPVNEESLVSLGVGIGAFWSKLKPE